jgi:SAM-dependent methyltransferase
MPDVRANTLAAMPYEAVKWEILKTALVLRVFDRLSEWKTADDVAAELATHPANTEYLLNALVAMDCLSKSDERFRNNPLAESFLAGGHDTSIGESLLFMDMWIAPLLNGGALKMVQNGPPPARDMADERIWEKGARISVNHSRCGRAQAIAQRVASLPEFATFSRVLDLGAGPGIIAVAVTAAHPSLECCVCDRPAVCKVAEEVIAEYDMQDRIRTRPGNYMEDPLGDGYDFVMAHYTLNFYRDRLDEIMSKVYRALKPSGVFMVTSDGLSKDKTAPAASIISWLSTSLQGMDMSFGRGTIANAMWAAGFVSTQSDMLADIELEAHGPMEMTIGRKSHG